MKASVINITDLTLGSANPAARPGGVTTTCSRLTAHGGSVALVGDAAHSMWPSLVGLYKLNPVYP
jgi:2-polyprenyl-6-methoxyphenol hydroxylase-like FAD-dependent oxidoreductase